MSDQNFENQHPRNRKGEFTDKPGSGPTTESDVALGGPVVVDAPNDGFLPDTGYDSDYSLGRSFRNRRTWKLPDGTYREVEVTYFVTGRVELPTEADLHDDFADIDFVEGDELTIDQYDAMYDVASGLPYDEQDRAPRFIFKVESRTHWSEFTHLEDRLGSSTARDTEYEGFNYGEHDWKHAAEAEAETRARDQRFGDHEPIN